MVEEYNSLNFYLKSKFSFSHTNLASLDAHIDDLRDVLSRLNTPFDIMALTEIKIRPNHDPSNNIDIPGYEFVHTPTETTHGGAGFYIKDDLDFEKRNDLSIKSSTHYETCFIEIIFDNRKNLVVG